MSRKSEERKRELEKEIARLQKKLRKIEGDDYFDDGNDYRRPLPPKPPKPAKAPQPPQRRDTIHMRPTLSKEDKERIKKEKLRIQKEREKIAKEISKISEEYHESQKEYQEMKREFDQVRKELRNQQRKLREKQRLLREKSHRSYTWDIDLDEDIEGMTSDLEVRLGDYTRSILASVADSLKSSMGIAIKATGDAGEDIKIVGKELGKIGKEIGDKISKEVKVSFGPTIPEDKLEEFFEVGATIVSAIGDPNRLRILKELEKAPMYQKELSDATKLRGGTFKHHMDKLLDDDVKFVNQEVVRGRYLLTTRGREALKLAEIQFMRYLEEKNREVNVKIIDSDDDDDEEYNVKIK